MALRSFESIRREAAGGRTAASRLLSLLHYKTKSNKEIVNFTVKSLGAGAADFSPRRRRERNRPLASGNVTVT
jgi:hypothetical protein